MQVAGGHPNDRIAERLEVSPLTVKTHVNRAMAKLGARDRAQLVVIAYESGLVRPRGTDPEAARCTAVYSTCGMRGIRKQPGGRRFGCAERRS